MAQAARPPKPVIGRREWIALPDLGVEHVKVKIDTEARSSALHAFDVEVFQRDGREPARFLVHPYQRETTTTVQAEAPVIGLNTNPLVNRGDAIVHVAERAAIEAPGT